MELIQKSFFYCNVLAQYQTVSGDHLQDVKVIDLTVIRTPTEYSHESLSISGPILSPVYLIKRLYTSYVCANFLSYFTSESYRFWRFTHI